MHIFVVLFIGIFFATANGAPVDVTTYFYIYRSNECAILLFVFLIKKKCLFI